jgi:hypothetical protein
LKFAQIHFLQLGLFMFSYNRSILPRKFENMFTLNYQVHSYKGRTTRKVMGGGGGGAKAKIEIEQGKQTKKNSCTRNV